MSGGDGVVVVHILSGTSLRLYIYIYTLLLLRIYTILVTVAGDDCQRADHIVRTPLHRIGVLACSC